mgnify:CR=1 FL=1
MSKYKLGDYTVKNWNDWDRVPRDPVTVGAAILQAAAPAFVAGLSGAAAIGLAYAVGYLAITAVTSWALNALTPKPDFGALDSSGILVNRTAGIAPQDFIYGEVRKGGIVTFYETTGSDNVYLHQIICLAGHEVNSIGDVYINFGFIGIVALAILLAFFMIKFIVWLKTNDCLKQFIAFYFAVHLMFLLRGDLTNGFSYFIGPLVSIVLLPKLLTRVIK